MDKPVTQPSRKRSSGLPPASWVTAQNVFGQAFGLLLFAVQAPLLGPLLGPRAFGLMALVMLFLGFCEWVLEIAATDALMSIANIDAKHYSTMTAANAVFATLLGVTVFAFAPRIATRVHFALDVGAAAGIGAGLGTQCGKPA